MRKNKFNWKKYVQDYRLKSIFVKNLFLMFFVIMLPVISLIVITDFAYTNVRENELKVYSERIGTQMVSDFNELFKRNREILIMLGMDSDIQRFLYQEEDQENVLYDITYLQKLFKVLISYTECIDNIYVYTPKSNMIYSKEGVRKLEVFNDITCIENIPEDSSGFDLKYLDRELTGGIRKRSLSMYYSNKLAGNGTIIINLDISKIKKAFQYDGKVSYRLVRENEILFSSQLSEVGGVMTEDVSLTDTEENKLVISKELEEEGLYLIVYVGDSVFESGGMGFSRIMFFCVIFMCVLIVFISLYISIKMTKPIEDILSVVEEIYFRDSEENSKEENEICYIMKSIYSAVERNANFEQELKQRTLLMKKAQAIALQAQINPHFMNNTLETVNQKVILQLGEKNEISDMVTNLSKIMRVALDRTKAFVRLEEEIQYTVMYLMIQEKRYKDRFCVHWNVSRNLLDCRVIKMILQPIVENALNHGILPYEDMGEIWIEAVRQEETLVLTVADSGFGMLQEELEKINQCMKGNVLRESVHIGLSNVNQRIRLAYGDEYGVSIFSEPTQGTKVVLSMPFKLQ